MKTQPPPGFTEDVDVTAPPPGFTEDVEVEKPGMINSFLQSAGNSALFGYAPQINAVLDPIIQPTLKALSGESDVDTELQAQGFKISGPKDTYLNRRDKYAEELKQTEQANPASSMGGSLVGSLAGGMGAAKLLPGLAVGEKAASLAKYGKPAAAAAIQAGAYNPGDEVGKADPLQLEQRAKNAAVGGIIGGVTSAAVDKIPSVYDYLMKKSNNQAVRALSPGKLSDIQKIAKFKDVGQVGKTLKDEGIITKLPKSPEGLQSAIESAEEKAGKELGYIIDEIDSSAKSLGKSVGVSRKAIVDELKSKLLQDEALIGDEATQSKLADMISKFESQGSDIIGVKEAEALKRKYQSQINYGRKNQLSEPVTEAFQRELASSLRKGVEDSAEQVAELTNQRGLSNQFKALKTKFSDLADAKNIIDDRVSRDLRNNFMTPSDYGVGGIGGIAAAAGGAGTLGSAATAAGLSAANHLAKKYGNQVNAKVLEGLANMLLKSDGARNLYQSNPAAFNQLLIDQYMKMTGK